VAVRALVRQRLQECGDRLRHGRRNQPAAAVLASPDLQSHLRRFVPTDRGRRKPDLELRREFVVGSVPVPQFRERLMPAFGTPIRCGVRDCAAARGTRSLDDRPAVVDRGYAPSALSQIGRDLGKGCLAVRTCLGAQIVKHGAARRTGKVTVGFELDSRTPRPTPGRWLWPWGERAGEALQPRRSPMGARRPLGHLGRRMLCRGSGHSRQ
jgi:hypothetical protein